MVLMLKKVAYPRPSQTWTDTLTTHLDIINVYLTRN